MALGSVLLAGCSALIPVMYSYRLTVEVDTPKDLRTGSSVIAVSATEGWGIPDTALRVTITGEAVAVDLPGGTLFALLGTRDNFDASASLPLCVMRQMPRHFVRRRSAPVCALSR